MKKTLVIIDMQQGFWTANAKRTIDNVIKQIKLARLTNEYIIIVEYLPHTKYETTRPEIMKAIGNHPYIKVYKYVDDGSKSILAACKLHDYPTDLFRICGVNTNACVRLTIKGLFKKNRTSKIEIVPAACNGQLDTSIFSELKLDYKVERIGYIPQQNPRKYI